MYLLEGDRAAAEETWLGAGSQQHQTNATPVAARVSRQLLQMGDSLWEKTGYDVGVGVKSLVFLALGKHVYPWEELSKL